MSGREVIVERWWNRAYGMARYDIWLKRWQWDEPKPHVWRVEAERGGEGGKFWASADLDSEERARAIIERIKAGKAGMSWALVRNQPSARERPAPGSEASAPPQQPPAEP